MIEGLKIHVKGDELQALCAARSAYHTNKAEDYRKNLASLEEISNPNSSLNPKREVSERMAQHTTSAAELDFIGTHLVLGETYELDRNDLVKLGIGSSRFDL